MRCLPLCLVPALVSYAILAATAWAAEAQPPADLGQCVLTIGGKAVDPATHAIVLPDKPTPQEDFAAKDLQAHVEKLTGKKLAIVADADLKDQTPLAVGKCEATLKKLGVQVDFDGLGIEGIAIETKGPALVLAGNKRGVLYAVYTFLEDSCGCRWFTPDCTVIPKTGDIKIADLKVRRLPPLELRSTDYPCSRPADWAVRNKMNGTQTDIDEAHGGKVSYSHFVHTFNQILDATKEFDKHPEWFSEVKGQRVKDGTQLCLTNPEVLAIAKKTVREWIAKSPEATIFSVSQNDWGNPCECKDCKALADAEGSKAAPLIAFVNAIADDIAKDHPDKLIDTLAYQWSRKPPKSLKPRPNVCVRLCSIECCFAHPLDGCEMNKTFVDDIRGWNKLTNRLYIWDYVINYAHSVMPFPNLAVLRPNIKFFVGNGVKGMYEEACYYTKASELQELRTWIIAKTLWNPNADTQKAVDEFLPAYYGAAAPAVRQYVDLLLKQVADHKDWHTTIYYGPDAKYLTPEFIVESVRLFDDAEAKVAADPKLLARVQVARLPVIYTQVMQAKPGEKTDDAAALIAKFETVARKAELTTISEDGGRGKLDTWLKAQRDRLKVAK